MTKMIVLAALLGTGCKNGDDRPPVKIGTCLVDKYEGEDAIRQTCKFQGYVWDCFRNICERLGEAPSERTAQTGAQK